MEESGALYVLEYSSATRSFYHVSRTEYRTQDEAFHTLIVSQGADGIMAARSNTSIVFTNGKKLISLQNAFPNLDFGLVPLDMKRCTLMSAERDDFASLHSSEVNLESDDDHFSPLSHYSDAGISEEKARLLFFPFGSGELVVVKPSACLPFSDISDSSLEVPRYERFRTAIRVVKADMYLDYECNHAEHGYCYGPQEKITFQKVGLIDDKLYALFTTADETFITWLDWPHGSTHGKTVCSLTTKLMKIETIKGHTPHPFPGIMPMDFLFAKPSRMILLGLDLRTGLCHICDTHYIPPGGLRDCIVSPIQGYRHAVLYGVTHQEDRPEGSSSLVMRYPAPRAQTLVHVQVQAMPALTGLWSLDTGYRQRRMIVASSSSATSALSLTPTRCDDGSTKVSFEAMTEEIALDWSQETIHCGALPMDSGCEYVVQVTKTSVRVILGAAILDEYKASRAIIAASMGSGYILISMHQTSADGCCICPLKVNPDSGTLKAGQEFQLCGYEVSCMSNVISDRVLIGTYTSPGGVLIMEVVHAGQSVVLLNDIKSFDGTLSAELSATSRTLSSPLASIAARPTAYRSVPESIAYIEKNVFLIGFRTGLLVQVILDHTGLQLMDYYELANGGLPINVVPLHPSSPSSASPIALATTGDDMWLVLLSQDAHSGALRKMTSLSVSGPLMMSHCVPVWVGVDDTLLLVCCTSSEQFTVLSIWDGGPMDAFHSFPLPLKSPKLAFHKQSQLIVAVGTEVEDSNEIRRSISYSNGTLLQVRDPETGQDVTEGCVKMEEQFSKALLYQKNEKSSKIVTAAEFWDIGESLGARFLSLEREQAKKDMRYSCLLVIGFKEFSHDNGEEDSSGHLIVALVATQEADVVEDEEEEDGCSSGSRLCLSLVQNVVLPAPIVHLCAVPDALDFDQGGAVSYLCPRVFISTGDKILAYSIDDADKLQRKAWISTNGQAEYIKWCPETRTLVCSLKLGGIVLLSYRLFRYSSTADGDDWDEGFHVKCTDVVSRQSVSAVSFDPGLCAAYQSRVGVLTLLENRGFPSFDSECFIAINAAHANVWKGGGLPGDWGNVGSLLSHGVLHEGAITLQAAGAIQEMYCVDPRMMDVLEHLESLLSANPLTRPLNGLDHSRNFRGELRVAGFGHDKTRTIPSFWPLSTTHLGASTQAPCKSRPIIFDLDFLLSFYRLEYAEQCEIATQLFDEGATSEVSRVSHVLEKAKLVHFLT